MKAVLFLMLVVVVSVHAQETTWRDKAGRDYLLLDGLKTWMEAEKECYQKGYALFDARFIADTDREAFLTSDIVTHINWEKVYAGTPREGMMGRIWQSSQVATIAGGISYASTDWLLFKRGDKLSTTQEQKPEEQKIANGVCMTVESFWHRCSSEFKCTFKNAASEWSWRYLFFDYGATENEAYKRIIERTEQPKWAVSEGKCGLVTSTMRCMRVLP